MAAPISVTEGAGTAFGFLRRAWGRAAGALALAGLLNGAAAVSFFNRDFARAGGLLAAYLLAAVMAQGALFRFAREPDRPDLRNPSIGPGGFQWGAIEGRLLAVILLRALLFGLLGALFLTVLAAIYVGMAAAEAGPGFAVASQARWRPTLDALGWTVVSGVGLAGLAGLGWVALRLYLAFPATVARDQVQLLSTWVLTRTRVLRILAATILIALPSLGVTLVARTGRGLLMSVGWGDQRLVAGICSLITGVGHTFLILPLSVGLMTYLYDRLGPEDAGAP